MDTTLHITLSWHDWLNLFFHYLLLSMMSLGGAISTTADMHRFLVEQQGWLTQAQFNDAIAIAQAAPGPNVLFVALMGWQVGMNAGSLAAAWLGVATTMTGILLPSTIFTYQVAQWGHRNRELRAVRAFKGGMAPVVIALLLSTAWILATAGGADSNWRLWLLALGSCLVIWRTRLHLLWILAAGALLGALGIV
ncbi:chromate transporter [Massilia sp. Dwa41.01b]|uniref:chromate transporter n=1 Tax=unclassified Massilia TaxID=2609279 RepID=UPI001600C12A|nr:MULTISPECIES: chromate transporter [unclassified Massilia]QNA89467.1 chromate transporter [Massilia sp. Dwa41.01b]QNB00371.1 chromate transporter [Massilia sp. Se16.2.3]